MNINELLVGPQKLNQRSNYNQDDIENKVRLFDFLPYPTLSDTESNSETDDIVLRDINIPDLHPKAAELVARLVEATGTLEVLEVFHDAYGMYRDGDLVIDPEASDELPGFWDKVLR